MPIVRGTVATRDYREERRRREEEERRRRPLVPLDHEDAARAVVSAYFNKTGKLPAPDTFNSYVRLVANNPLFRTGDDVEQLFPDWVREVENPEDPTPYDIFLSPVREVTRIMEERGIIPTETTIRMARDLHRAAHAEFRRERESFEKTVRGRLEPAETEYEQKGRYFRLTGGATGTDILYRGWNDDDEAVVRFDPAGTGQFIDPMDGIISARRLTYLRERFYGKPRSELTKEERLFIDALAQRIAWEHGDQFAAHYAYDTKNVMWDAHFDQHVAMIVVHQALSFAVQRSQLDPDGKLMKAARRNIAVATYGRVRPTGNEYELLKMLGIRGAPGDTARTSDELAEMLFAGYHAARPGHFGLRESAISYAAYFGEAALPPSVRPLYNEFMKDWNPRIAQAIAVAEREAEAIQVAAEKPAAVGLDHTAGVRTVGRVLRSLTAEIEQSVEQLPDDEFDLGIEAGKRLHLRTGRERVSQALSPDAIRARILQNVVFPSAGVPKSDFFEEVNYWSDRILLTIAYGVNSVEAALIPSLLAPVLGEERERQLVEKFLERRGLFFGFTVEERNILARAGYREDGRFADPRAVWYLAGKVADLHRDTQVGFSKVAWQRFDETFGTNMAENKYAVFFLDLGSKLALDIALDRGLTKIFRLAKTGITLAKRGALEYAIQNPRDIAVSRAMLIGEKPSVLKEATKWMNKAMSHGGTAGRIRNLNDQLSSLRNRLADTTDEAAAKSISDEIARTEKELDDILSTPLWFNPMSRVIAGGKQNVAFLKLVFGYSDDGLGWRTREVVDEAGNVTTERYVDDILKGQQMREVTELFSRMAESRNPDEVYDIAVTLRSKYGVDIDPGASFISKQHAWNHYSNVYDSGALFSRALPYGLRFVDAADEPLHAMDVIGTLSNMGLPKGDPRGREILADLLEQAATVGGKTGSEIHQNRRLIWDEMWSIIERNLMERPVTASEQRAIKLLAKISGVTIDTPTNRLDLFKAIQKVKLGGKGLRASAGTKAARMYLPGYEVDETGRLRIVELSKVKKVRHPVVEAAREKYDDAKKVYDRVKKAHEKGEMSGKELEGAAMRLEAAQSELELAKRSRHASQVQPFLEGQLARDLIAPMTPHELAIFQSGAIKFETLLHLGLLGGWGPSVHGLVSAFRTFILARMGFAVTAAFGDEFWRLIPEGVWSTIMRNNGKFRAHLKDLKETKQLAKAVTDNLADMMRLSDSWVGVTHEAPDYHVWLNGYLEMLRDESSVHMVRHFPRMMGESDEAYRNRLIRELRNLIDGTSDVPYANEVGAILREHLAQMGRAPRGGIRTVQEKFAAKKLEQAAREAAEDAYTVAYFNLEDNLRRQRELQEKVGRLGRPTKAYTVKWLRRRYAPRAKLSDKEIFDKYSGYLEDKDVTAALKKDYHQSLVRERKVQRQYRELLRLKEERKELSRIKTAANRQRRVYQKVKGPPDERNLDEWIEQTIDHIISWERYPQARAALLEGKKLSKRDVKGLVRRMLDDGIMPPPVIGVRSLPRWGEGYLPGFSKFADMGPFRLLDWATSAMRRATFTSWHTRYYDEFVKMGMDEDMAWGRAVNLAQRATDRAMYTHNMTVFEYLTRDFILFQPAFRQFGLYWGKQLLKHPFLMSEIYGRGKTDYPVFRIPGTQMETTLPMPFWLTADITEVALPGVSPPIIMLLRTANYATGWEWVEDQQTYIYTGDTDLDHIARFPPLSFVNKSSSPTSWLDDLLWGIKPDFIVPDSESSRFWTLVASAQMSFFRDPRKREQLAMNIAQTQIAHGRKPDWVAGIEEMRQKPGWWRFIEGIDFLNIVENPDAVLASGTKLLNPVTGRMSYDPALNDPEKTRFFWDKWAGTRPRTMADAQYAFLQAFGDAKKEQEVFNMFPEFKAVHDFWDMDIEEREEFLSKDKNLWIVPYITGKYFYEDGIPLIGGEFWDKMKDGSIYRKSLNAFLEDVREVYLNVGWTRTIRKLEREHKQAMREADAFAKQAIDELAGDNDLLREALKRDYIAYKNGWTKPAPGNDYKPAEERPPQWLVLAARKAGIEEDVFKWDVGKIAQRMSDSFKLVSDGGKRLEAQGGEGPLEASYRGIRDRWVHRGIYDDDKDYKDKLGAALKLVDGLKKYTSPRWDYLLDRRRSVSWPEIARILKDKREYHDYLTEVFAAGEYWKLNNSSQLLAIGVKTTNRKAMEQGMVDLKLLYWSYQKAIENVRPMSDEYKAIRGQYLKARNAIMEREGMEAFRDGPAGRLHAAYGKYGRGIDRNWLNHVFTTMTKKSRYSPGKLVEKWLEKQVDAGSFEKRRERAAWASLTLVAMQFRKELKGKWNEAMGAYGYSPEAKAASVYLRKLEDYAKIWSRVSPEFARRYKNLGGEELLKLMLDPNA